MTININWLTNKPNTLHCHLGGNWTLRDVRELALEYQYQTAKQVAPFDMILTADSAPDSLPIGAIDFAVHHMQQTLIIVNAHTFYQQFSSAVAFAPSSCLTVFAGSWTEACHFVAA